MQQVDDELFWHKDGRGIPVEYTSTPIRNERGAIEGAVLTVRDITERKAAEGARSPCPSAFASCAGGLRTWV